MATLPKITPPSSAKTVEQYNKDFQANNPQYFTPQSTQTNGYWTGGTVNAQGVNIGGGKFVQGTPPVNTTLDGSALGNTSPIVVPPPNTSPTTNNLAMSNNAFASTVGVDANYTPPTNAATEKKSAFESLKSAITGNQSQIDTLNNDPEVLAKKQRAQASSATIDQMDKDYRDEVKQIKENPEGLFGGGLQAKINAATDRYQNNRANEALAYQVLNNDYKGAQETINNKVASLKEKSNNDIALYTAEVNSLNNDMTESETMQAQAEIARKERESTLISSSYSDVLKQASQNGAPASVLSAIDAAVRKPNATASDIYAAAGTYAKKSIAISGTPGVISSISQAIIDNPNLINSLTPTVKGQVITELSMAGYDTTRLGGKPLSDVAITNIAQSQSAIDGLNDLKSIIETKKELIGPIVGLAALNPYSEARQVQASIDKVKQRVGKTLEGGVLRLEDEKKYKKILATITDTPETALYKLEGLISDITRDLNNYKTLQAGAGKSDNVTGSLEKKGEPTKTTTPTTSTDYRSKYGY